MAGEITIRPVKPGDRAAWEPLWQGYLTFYKSTLASDITDATWRRFFDPLERLGAFVAERDGQLIGIAHYLLHRSTWAPLCYCYLEDLFVEPSARGSGAGRNLIAAVESAAREAGASRLYWMTHETNETAQKLYNQVAERPGFVQYRKKF
ncbi:MAG: GNAT family N-acetyltransferase [Alphaproteobacteria bacterium]|jgi:GNAT superfamily N-acetyltransferase|nr:MAG: GNAT family N-acetyltransferase [Alphaproteobacteria bacterium]